MNTDTNKVEVEKAANILRDKIRELMHEFIRTTGKVPSVEIEVRETPTTSCVHTSVNVDINVNL